MNKKEFKIKASKAIKFKAAPSLNRSLETTMPKRVETHKSKPNKTVIGQASSFYREPTQREIEVIRLVAEGHKNREIAEKIGISVKTVETHRSNVMNKLAFKNVVDLMTYAVKKGIIRIQIEK